LKSRSVLFFSALLVSFCLSASLIQGAERFPQSRGAINDFANVISPPQKKSMELLAREVLQKTGTTVVVATVQSIEDNDLTDYANRLYEAWGIGIKGEDKGVLIILAVKERKIRIETGYGVEGILPDGLVGDILDRYVVPYLKQNNYDKGLTNALVAVCQIIAKDAAVSLTGSPAGSTLRHPTERPQLNPFSLIMLAIVIALLLGTRQGRRMLPFIIIMLMMGGRGGSGGGFGGFSGGFGGFGGGLSGGGGAGRGF
jgi:uncharacterized protein